MKRSRLRNARASKRRAAEHPFQLRRDRLRRNRPCLHVRSIRWTPTVARPLKRDVRNVTATSVTRSYFHGSHLTRHCATASIARRGQLELVSSPSMLTETEHRVVVDDRRFFAGMALAALSVVFRDSRQATTFGRSPGPLITQLVSRSRRPFPSSCIFTPRHSARGFFCCGASEPGHEGTSSGSPAAWRPRCGAHPAMVITGLLTADGERGMGETLAGRFPMRSAS